MKRLAWSLRHVPRWQAVLVLLASCSFQNFDYLEQAPGGAGGGSSGQDTGGSSSTAGSGSSKAGSSSPADGGESDPGGAGAPAVPGKGGAGGSDVVGGGGVADQAGGVGGAGGEGNGSGTGNAGTGAVGQLVNPSFETGSTLGWEAAPSDALSKRYAFVQLAQGTATIPDGAYQLSTWHMTDTFAVEVHQKITGLEDGSYRFKGYFTRGDGFNSVSMFARKCGATDPEPVPVPVTDAAAWLAVEVAGIEVVGGSCEVGLSIDSNPTNWLNADFFSFEKEVE